MKFLKGLLTKANIVIASILVVAVVAPVATAFAIRNGGQSRPNIILMVPDGMSLAATTLARYMQPDNPNAPEAEWTFTGERRLAIDEHVQGLMRTAWAGGPITDSAPAATAMATGHHSNNLRIGLDRNDDPRATVMQAARSVGMSTGLVMNSEFMHATPAAFMSHEVARFNYDNLARQMLANRPNVVLGTGSAQARSFNVYQRGYPETVSLNVSGAYPHVLVPVRVADITRADASGNVIGTPGTVPHFQIRDNGGYRRIFDTRTQYTYNAFEAGNSIGHLDRHGVAFPSTLLSQAQQQHALRPEVPLSVFLQQFGINQYGFAAWGPRIVDPEGYTVDSSRRRIVERNNWRQQVVSEGYQVVTTRAQMNRLLRPTSSNAADLRVWGDFNGGLTMLGENYRYLSFDIDRRFRPDLDEPSLAEMTRTAIDLLSSNRNGFMLVVEGSKIDWAAHVHDAVALTSDILAFDRAFQVAQDFARRCGNTIVIVASDHATGGLTIGSSDLSFDVPGQENTGPWTFDEAPWEMLAPLRNAVMGNGRSAEAALQLFVMGRERVIHRQQAGGLIDWAANHNEVLAAYGINYDFWDYYGAKTNAELNAIATYLLEEHRTTPVHVRSVHNLIQEFRMANPSSGVNREIGQGHLVGNGMQFLSSAQLQNAQRMLAGIMNQMSFITFSTNWHHGDDVPFYMYAPRGMSHTDLLGRRGNHINNTDIARMIASALEVCLDALTDRLFVEIYNDGKSVIDDIEVTLESARFQRNFTREGFSDQNNGSSWVDVVFTITRGNRVVTVTAGTNYFVIDGRRTTLTDGVIVYLISQPQFTQTTAWSITGANRDTGRLFVPRQLINAL
ncbi:MAG: alkaline phosphatase [Firmicutes bacterium]|nr:alkaline phosphatase [Bacillota bacterium]